MTPHQFIAKWRNGGDERRDAQPFFEDLCRLVGHATPREADPEHVWFTYEYGATKTSGGNGWADVWKKGFFGWEAKGTHRSLDRAYQQLKMYADALQNPPLLVVSDLQTIIVHTNFTNSVKKEYKLTVADLETYEARQVLDAVFKNPEMLRPGKTRIGITQEAAEKFSTLARALRERAHEPHAVAHFLNRLMFCMFAEDIGLLPDHLFTRLVNSSRKDPALFEKRSRELFGAMHKGGDVAFENVEWFNGGLFESDETIRLEVSELKILNEACALDWDEIEPSIFGTLFERGLDPTKRSQLGAHYTDPSMINKIIKPVIIEPWIQRWEDEKLELSKLLNKAKKTVSKAATDRFNLFLEEFRRFQVLDPACGSGNFLYISLRALKDIEKRILIEGEALGLGRQFPAIGPANVKGLEVNDYAAELARITIWIGEIQWMIQNGYGARTNPILQPLEQIETRDALLGANNKESPWPKTDVIVGNPPFLGGSKILGELGADYVRKLRGLYESRVPRSADLVCYWFARASELLAAGKVSRVGLVATNSIRGGTNRVVLDNILAHGRIFDSWSDEAWINEGAAVRVSLICFTEASAQLTRLNGVPVTSVYADLTGEIDAGSVNLTKALKLKENQNLTFSGTKKGGEFELSGDVARSWLDAPNPNGRPNSEVLRPWVNGMWLTRGAHDTWIIDFGTERTKHDASLYEEPFKWVEEKVLPVRAENRRASRRDNWWLHSEVCVGMRKALAGLSRYIATPRVSKHRVFVWLHPEYLIDDGVYCVARDDETTFGILHSRFHELWSLRMGTSLEDRPRYTPTSCFETFPFPAGLTPNQPAHAFAGDARAILIDTASKELNKVRDNWLYPEPWTDRITDATAYPKRIVAKPGFEDKLKERTLSRLYSENPTWLKALHDTLNSAVSSAYGWEWPLSDDEILLRLFALNAERSSVGLQPAVTI